MYAYIYMMYISYIIYGSFILLIVYFIIFVLFVRALEQTTSDDIHSCDGLVGTRGFA